MSVALFSFFDRFLPDMSKACTRLRSGQDCWISFQEAKEARARLASGTDPITAMIAAGRGSLQTVQELWVQGTGFRLAKSTWVRMGEGSLADNSWRVNLLQERLVSKSWRRLLEEN